MICKINQNPTGLKTVNVLTAQSEKEIVVV